MLSPPKAVASKLGNREQHCVQQPLLVAALWIEHRERVDQAQEVGTAFLFGA